MKITIFHNDGLSCKKQVYSNASVRIVDAISFVDSGIESDCNAIVRIFTKSKISVSAYDRIAFGDVSSAVPPDNSYIIKRIYDNRGGILSHMRLDCVC